MIEDPTNPWHRTHREYFFPKDKKIEISSAEIDSAVSEYLRNGGTVTQLDAGNAEECTVTGWSTYTTQEHASAFTKNGRKKLI